MTATPSSEKPAIAKVVRVVRVVTRADVASVLTNSEFIVAAGSWVFRPLPMRFFKVDRGALRL
jgi:hypothetical protein